MKSYIQHVMEIAGGDYVFIGLAVILSPVMAPIYYLGMVVSIVFNSLNT